MNPRFREIHRSQIQKRLYRSVDQQWDALLAVFSASIILIGFGVRFCVLARSGSGLLGGFFLFLGGCFFVIYRSHLKTLSKRYDTQWLTGRDQLTYIAIYSPAVFLSEIHPGFMLPFIFGAGVFGVWRLRSNLRPHWRRYYFRVARAYIREIHKYGSGKPTTRVSEK